LALNAIEKAKREGNHFLDFRPTSLANKCLIHYKEKWGASFHDSCVFCPEVLWTSALQDDSHLYKTATAAWKKMPNWIAEPLGTRLYQHLA